VRPTLTCVEGVGMHRHSARLARYAGGALIAAVVSPWLGGGVALAGSAKPAPPSGDDRATSFSGNVTTCAQIGLPNDTLIGGGTGSYTADGWDVQSDGTNLTVNSVADTMQIDALVVGHQPHRRLDVAVLQFVPLRDQAYQLVEDALHFLFGRSLALDDELVALRANLDAKDRLDVLEIAIMRSVERLESLLGKRDLLHALKTPGVMIYESADAIPVTASARPSRERPT